MKAALFRLSTLAVLSLLVAVFSTPSFAQDIYNSSPVNPDMPPATFNNPQIPDNQAVSYANSPSIGSVLRYWWLVPVVLLPALAYLLFRWSTEETPVGEPAYLSAHYQQLRRSKKPTRAKKRSRKVKS